jgi:hypothetical protein
MQDITVCCVSNTAFVSVHLWFSFRVSLMFISLCIEYLLYSKSSLKYFNMVQILVRMSVWLLVNANLAMFQLYHGENKLIFNEMMVRSPSRPTRWVGFW